MEEFQGFVKPFDHLHAVGSSLCHNTVAEIAIHWDSSAILSRVVIVMTAEAAIKLKVADMVGICAPFDLHLREEVFLICILDPCNSLFEKFRL
jgi:hypothetical protein